MTACLKTDDNVNDSFIDFEVVQLMSNDPCFVGDFHNFVLDMIINAVPNDTAASPEEGIQFVRIVYDSASRLYISETEMAINFSDTLVSDDFLLYVAHSDFHYIPTSEIVDNLNDLEYLGLITSAENALMLQSYNSSGNLEELQLLLNDWENLNLDTTEWGGAISKAAICISISSTVYWSNFQGDILFRVSPAHVDVGGFIIGAGLSALSHNNLSWSDVPDIIATGVMTGVIASSGVAARFGRWLFGGG